MILDRFQRKIDYLRVSVTDRCNLRCVYCMPENGIKLLQHKDILTYEEISQIAETALNLGFSKIRLTGGEPLVRKEIEKLIAMISSMKGLQDFGLTTNGVLLYEKAELIKGAGIHRINVSLDTLNEKKYKEITRIGDLNKIIKGLLKAKEIGLPVKINMVVSESTKKEEISDIQRFCAENGFELQLISEYMLTEKKEFDCRFQKPPDCSLCSRLRILADGTVKPCLHSDLEYKIDMNDIKGSLLKAVELKPKKGEVCTEKEIYQIGG